ncbi:hypothetical protein Q4566_01650 [Tamlana sp. 2_MG-2023]|uniref:hypothetical protein n=1 Tax=unclassified Tamlana TaxID=2614803 RepID=UPI0026E31A5F|nr:MULTISPECIES: hypothetical protein [unclassified Tamlana]MDO6758888.1 hypothetical protein [Tamlana sp. 2_MG-2023]MDO6789587.1 hypothetical protein [Tamlana sp. 1_MG-2023]
MKQLYPYLFFLFFLISASAQERFLTVTSKDSVNEAPRFKSSLGVNMKLNGYFDVFGGLQDSDTFNVGKINVFGSDDANSLNVDLYQTQIKWETLVVMPNGKKIKAIVESDFWGGDGRLRLRKAYVETEHWQIGQNWNNFGDEDLWPNIMEWEGPPSGIWLRNPHIKYMNTFKNTDWKYEISLEAPQDDFYAYEELQPFIEEARQSTPDVTFAVTYKKPWGHLRAASLLRSINYKLDGDEDNFIGYGLTLSGIYKPNRNSFQYQLVGGKGISSYLTTIAGFGYDGYPAVNNEFKATPAFGGWMAYEYFITEKWHANAVFGMTNFTLSDSERYVIVDDLRDELIDVAGDFNHKQYYGILNMMYDAYDRMTIGLEMDYGVKSLNMNGDVGTTPFDQTQKRDALRISFGFMFFF